MNKINEALTELLQMVYITKRSKHESESQLAITRNLRPHFLAILNKVAMK